ncbi:type 2 lanthipeptide synthetase LanM [Priestia koreensis]|uniref:type 2 lanthipeptide synthetase LanM n=1 Tax=Priestia koreensis TaxID=284581 RepID=UPI002041D197|nr:type 2 lanthipeptide synthetase LanM [Priestia koreensis]MCM3003316.1 type 2 lanthipeptide synthetase LanM [Priestia koreensis]
MQLVAEKLVYAVENLFADEINQTKDKVKEHLSKQNCVAHAEIASMDCLHTLLQYHVWRLCHKTFVYEFHKYRESLSYPADPSSSKIFDQYVSMIDKEIVSKWFEKYDFLKKMITQSVKNTRSFIESVSQHFSNDAALLLSKGLIKSGAKLQSITPLESDPHNGSKVNLCLEFESSIKLLYKPRSLEVDVLIDNLFSETLKFDALQGHSPVPRTINRDKYGWQEFVQHTSINQLETSDAYYNLGLCAAVFSCLGATDLHDENIIFNGTFPYFVDLETSLQPKYHDGRGHSLPELMQGRIMRSIANTSIIPAKQLTLPHEILIGAINTPYPQETNEMVFTLKNAGTDAIDLAKEKITVKRTTVPITLVGNQPPDPLPFQKDFLNGYSDGYEKVMDKREQIYSTLTHIECSVRVVIRPTSQYYLMLDACLFPENLIDETTINKVLHYLKPPKLVRDSEIAKKTLKEEIRSIKAGDIPHFSIKANDKRLYSMDFVSNDIFDVSPANNAITMLQELSEEKLIHDQRIIAEGYSEIRIHESKYKNIEDLGYQSPLFSNALQKVTKDNPDPLVELIQSLAITTKGDNAETGWIGGVYGNIPISYDSIALISLHDTGGILFLLEHMKEYKQSSQEYIELLNQANKGLSSLRHAFSAQLESAPKSIISGASSLDFVFGHHLTRAKEIEDVATQLLSEDTAIGDAFIGLTGLGLTLASFSNTPNETLRELESKIFIESSSAMLPSDGIAHGNLGTIWSQFRLSYALKNMEKCNQLLEQALQISFPNSAGWCNGNAGLLMVLAEMASLLNQPIDLYEVAKRSTELFKDRPVDLSICHGAAGVLQSLLFAYQALGDSWYLSLANQYWENTLNLAKTNGFYTGEKNRDYLLGYFLGWSGVADSALMLKMYNNNKSIWFPLNLSSVSYQQNYAYKINPPKRNLEEMSQ